MTTATLNPWLPLLRLPLRLPRLAWKRLTTPGARELREMSDHELKDLGIGRSEVERLLGGPATGRP